MQFVARLSLGREEVGQWGPSELWACLPLVFECELKKGIVGARAFQACRARPTTDTPNPFEKFSVCIELNINAPEPKLSWMLLARLGGDRGRWGFGSERYAEALWFLVHVSYLWFQNYPNI